MPSLDIPCENDRLDMQREVDDAAPRANVLPVVSVPSSQTGLSGEHPHAREKIVHDVRLRRTGSWTGKTEYQHRETEEVKRGKARVKSMKKGAIAMSSEWRYGFWRFDGYPSRTWTLSQP